MDRDGSYVFSEVVPVTFGNDFDIVSGPNPAKEFVQLLLSGEVPQGMRYVLSDLHGKRIATGEMTSSRTTVNIGNLIQGTYVINITRNGELVRTFKVIKSN